MFQPGLLEHQVDKVPGLECILEAAKVGHTHVQDHETCYIFFQVVALRLILAGRRRITADDVGLSREFIGTTKRPVAEISVVLRHGEIIEKVPSMAALRNFENKLARPKLDSSPVNESFGMNLLERARAQVSTLQEAKCNTGPISCVFRKTPGNHAMLIPDGVVVDDDVCCS